MGRKRKIPQIDKIIYEKEADEYQHMYLMHFDSMKSMHYVFNQTHVHQAVEMIICESGKLSFRTSNGVGNIKAKQVLLINSYDRHYYSYDDDFTGYIFVVSSDYTKDVLEYGTNEFNNILKIKNDDDWKELLNKLNHLFLNYEKMTFLRKKGETLLIYDLLAKYNLVRSKNNRETKDLSSEIFRYIEENYHRKLTLESVAKDFCYSKAYFCSLFSEISQNGMSFYSYLNFYRAKKVIEMRKDKTFKGVPIKKLAVRAGFSSPQAFYRVYKTYSAELEKKY